MNRSITLKMLIILMSTSLVAICAGLILLAVNVIATSQVKRDVGLYLADKSYSYADKLDRDMWSRAQEITILSRLEVFQQAQDLKQLSAVVQQLHESIPAYAWIGFLDANGTVLVSSNGVLQGKNIAQRPVYQNALHGLFVGDVHDAVLLAKLLPNPTGEAMKFVDISMPVRDGHDRLSGVLATHLSWSWVNQLDRSIFRHSKERENVELFVVSKDGSVLLGQKDYLGQQLDLEILKRDIAKEPTWMVERWPDGVEYLTGAGFGDGHLTYPGLGWTVLARQPLDVAYGPVFRMQYLLLGIGVFFACAVAAIGAFTAQWITRPLQGLVDTAKRLRRGTTVAFPPYAGIRDIEELYAALKEMVVNLTLAKAERDDMKTMAFVDKLTFLPNRRALEEKMAALQNQMPRRNVLTAFLYLDLDGFKAINDTLGHDAGDITLQVVAERLEGCLRSDAEAYRLGGDEFVIVAQVDRENARQETAALAERVIATLNRAIPIDGQTASVGCSIGAAFHPQDAQEAAEALKLADAALYHAKQHGKNRLAMHSDI